MTLPIDDIQAVVSWWPSWMLEIGGLSYVHQKGSPHVCWQMPEDNQVMTDPKTWHPK